jgi:hypothetical protein
VSPLLLALLLGSLVLLLGSLLLLLGSLLSSALLLSPPPAGSTALPSRMRFSPRGLLLSPPPAALLPFLPFFASCPATLILGASSSNFKNALAGLEPARQIS